MLFVKMRGRSIADKELRSISIRSSISHRENTRVSVRKPDSFISELFAINTLTSSSISFSSVSTLHHEAINDSVELVSLVRRNISLLSSAQFTEVIASDGSMVLEEFENNATLLLNFGSSSSNLNVEEDLRVLLVKSRQFAYDLVLVNLGSSLFLVETLSKCLLVGSSFTLGGLSFLFSNNFVLFANGSVFRVNRVGLTGIIKSIIIIL